MLRDVLRSVSFLPSLMCNRFICVVQGLSVPDELVLKSQTIPHVLLEETLRLFLFFLKETSSSDNADFLRLSFKEQLLTTSVSRRNFKAMWRSMIQACTHGRTR